MGASFHREHDRCAAIRQPATILIVEDEALVRALVAEELREQTYAVVEAADADEALSILHDNGPVDIMLTDVRMPGKIDGVDLARMVRAEFPAMKIVIASGHMPASEVDGMIDGFFAKPYDFSKLFSGLKALLPCKEPAPVKRG